MTATPLGGNELARIAAILEACPGRLPSPAALRALEDQLMSVERDYPSPTSRAATTAARCLRLASETDDPTPLLDAALALLLAVGLPE